MCNLYANRFLTRRTRIDKVNSELVVLTYGTIVAQLCKDFDSDYVEVNKQLDKMGYNIGLRLIEDYLAKSNTMKRCANFRETAEMISKVRTKARSILVGENKPREFANHMIAGRSASRSSSI